MSFKGTKERPDQGSLLSFSSALPSLASVLRRSIAARYTNADRAVGRVGRAVTTVVLCRSSDLPCPAAPSPLGIRGGQR